MVRRKPKFTPEASSMTLLGPGLMEVTKARAGMARSVVLDMAADSTGWSIALLMPRRAGCVRSEIRTRQDAAAATSAKR